MSLRAPYNFVPISDKVFFPKWSKNISHEIPFSDGISGVIELIITARTPIFVRNGHLKDEKEFNSSHFNGKYFIPSTSIKGAIRNILEIISFSKIKLDEGAMFAQREWRNEQLYPLKRKQKEIFCGWLRPKGNDFVIVDCEKPYRIAHTKIDDYIGRDLFRSNFSSRNGIDLNVDQELNGREFNPKTSEYKYELLKNYLIENLNFSIDNDFSNDFQPRRVKVDPKGEINGTIVLTGQPNKWVWPRPKQLIDNAGKFYEFVFSKDNSKEIPFLEKDFNRFKFIYSGSNEWKSISKELNSDKGIPVFFRKENSKIKDLGLAYLYKLPYDNSPFDTLSDFHKDKNQYDLAECIFGSTGGDKPLKGRVQFTHAFSKNAEKDRDYIFTMGSPKASYYPIYINQSRNWANGRVNNYSTYNDGKISGWKRYPIRGNIWGEKDNENFNETLDTKLIPVKPGAIFTSKINFHNLKRVELGALLSALKFHNSEDCLHQIGQGKAFGLGLVKISASLINYNETEIESLMGEFEGEIQESMNINWTSDNSIVQLFTMASIPIPANDVLFEYMQMSTKRNDNEFLRAKNNNEYLELYSTLVRSEFRPKSIYAKIKKELEKQNELEKQEEVKKKKELEEQIIKELKLREERNRIASNQVSLADRIRNAKHFNTVYGNISTWLKINGFDAIPAEELPSLFSKLKELFISLNNRDKEKYREIAKWKELEKFVGSERTCEFLKSLD